jgi:hypothetical protein
MNHTAAEAPHLIHPYFIKQFKHMYIPKSSHTQNYWAMIPHSNLDMACAMKSDGSKLTKTLGMEFR